MHQQSLEANHGEKCEHQPGRQGRSSPDALAVGRVDGAGYEAASRGRQYQTCRYSGEISFLFGGNLCEAQCTKYSNKIQKVSDETK